VVRRSTSGVIAQPSWPVPATIQSAWAEVSEREVEFEILRHDKEALEFDVTRCRFAEFFRALGDQNSARCRYARRISTSRRPAKADSASYEH
jgi:hypothetical protein